MDSTDPVMATQGQRRWFIELVTTRFGGRVAEVRWILDIQLQFTMFDAADAAKVIALARAEGVELWVTVLVVEPSDLSAWEDLRHELIRLGDADPRVISAYPTPDPGYRRPPVAIRLAAHGEQTARTLHERFGPFIALTVGFLAFPSRERAARSNQMVEPVHYSCDTPVTFEEPVRVRSGHAIQSEVLLTNHRSTPMTVNTNGHLTALIVDAAGQVVGTYAGGQRLPLHGFRAEPGGTVRIPS